MWIIGLVEVAQALPGPGAVWTVLSSGDPVVECTDVAGEPWCRSTGMVSLPIDKVAATLENMAQHQALFESIVSIQVVAPDVMHITLDFPSPLSDRDYVAKYTRGTQGEVRTYSWVPATVQVPAVSGVVRLPKMAGEWRLEPVGNETKVTYTWHAEIAGSFPDALLGQARKKAGGEALKDIRKASAAAAATGG
jgi:carbon monoxide dehydrogenase subunit G